MTDTVTASLCKRKRFVGGLALLIACGLPADAVAALRVSAGATHNVSCSGGTCMPTAEDAVLNVTQLETMLAAGNVTLTTTGTGGMEAGDLLIDGFLTWSDQTTLRLTAYHSVVVSRTVNVMGPGGVSVMTNGVGSDGALSFTREGRIAFHHRAAQLAIDSVAYQLVEDLPSLINAIAKSPAGHFALAHDYDASVGPNYQLAPIQPVFTGALEGLGNAILHLTIHDKGNGGNETGLFSEIGEDGVVADLRLFDIDIVVLKEPETYVGGIASGLEGTLRNDRVTGRIVAIHAFAGGLVGGTNGNPTIVHSSADVDVQAGIAGGLLGFGGSTVIAYSYATGSVEASKVKGRRIPHTAGGLVGVGYGTIDQSFATGRVTGGASATIGGLVGIAEMTITNSYALGDLRVVAGTQAGGLIGLSFQQASTSYAANGVLSGATDAFGGFVSSTGARAVFSDDYWDSVTSGTQDGIPGGNQPGVTGLTTAQLTAALPGGFDPAIWGQSPTINHGYPYLLANPPR